MERSSPLAAIHRPAMLGHWGRPNGPSDFLEPLSYRPRNFDFRDMSMFKSNTDYFSYKSARGSSPTSSLAVDLSQNFHIDRSPQLPTPRRALFTAKVLDSRAHNVITPPIPSSSPGPGSDIMDISPLPHKPLHAITQQVQACSPTPEVTPVPDEARPPSETVHTFGQPSLLSPARNLRKFQNTARPLFRRNQSTSAVPVRPCSRQNSENLFPFGPGLNSTNKPSLEAFAESPPSERKPASHCTTFPLGSTVHARPPLFQLNGSPVASGIRRNSGPRPSRLGARRTQSVQYNHFNPFKNTRQEKRCCTTGSMQPKIDADTYNLKLPHFRNEDDPESLPRITKETFVDVLDGAYHTCKDEVSVIDCRFEYEFQGGHIDCAQNFNDKECLAKQLFEQSSHRGKLLIFHCEYSAHRAPLMAKYIRQRDRAHNLDRYPELSFPEIYILDGGYSSFFASHSCRCFPQSYVEMVAKEHEGACEAGMAKVKRRTKLSRAQTYAFGQSLTASPVPSISNSFASIDAMEIDFSSPTILTNKQPRRQDSY